MLLERLATAQARCRNDRSLGLQDMTQIGAFTAAYILYLRFDPARCTGRSSGLGSRARR